MLSSFMIWFNFAFSSLIFMLSNPVFSVICLAFVFMVLFYNSWFNSLYMVPNCKINFLYYNVLKTRFMPFFTKMSHYDIPVLTLFPWFNNPILRYFSHVGLLCFFGMLVYFWLIFIFVVFFATDYSWVYENMIDLFPTAITHIYYQMDITGFVFLSMVFFYSCFWSRFLIVILRRYTLCRVIWSLFKILWGIIFFHMVIAFIMAGGMFWLRNQPIKIWRWLKVFAYNRTIWIQKIMWKKLGGDDLMEDMVSVLDDCLRDGFEQQKEALIIEYNSDRGWGGFFWGIPYGDETVESKKLWEDFDNEMIAFVERRTQNFLEIRKIAPQWSKKMLLKQLKPLVSKWFKDYWVDLDEWESRVEEDENSWW